ncbi:Protein suppressor of hairy wing [Eumeta japonica]|uniref:Protein suppressor of hairy wing n=1 Tax=Eumeta variegata TaxID=151549 RepID=A0A4C1VI08_EUMVA|nr:Protein suppressor of hairy wing [Eumeta japonica]
MVKSEIKPERMDDDIVLDVPLKSEFDTFLDSFCHSDSSNDCQPLSEIKTIKKKVKEIRKKNKLKEKHRIKCAPTYCNLCRTNLENTENLSEHKKKFHGIDNGVFTCFGCDKNFKSARTRLDHELQYCKKLKDGYECSICKRYLPIRRTYEAHMRAHRENATIDLPEKLFKCRVCEERFKTRTLLQQHTTEHRKKPNYVCEVCGRVFTRRDYLHKHTLTHSGVRRHACPHCDFKATQAKLTGVKDPTTLPLLPGKSLWHGAGLPSSPGVEKKANRALAHMHCRGVKNKLRFTPSKTHTLFTEKLKYDGQWCTWMVNNIAKEVKVTWALNPEIMRTIYVSAIEPIVLFASCAWDRWLEFGDVFPTGSSKNLFICASPCARVRNRVESVEDLDSQTMDCLAIVGSQIYTVGSHIKGKAELVALQRSIWRMIKGKDRLVNVYSDSRSSLEVHYRLETYHHFFLYFRPCEGQGGAKIHYGQSVRPDARGVSDSHGLKTPRSITALAISPKAVKPVDFSGFI